MYRYLRLYLALFITLSALLTPSGHATAVGRIDPASGKYVIHAHLIYYGTEATEAIARASTDEINRLWNTPQIHYIHEGHSYPVVFNVSYDVYEEDPRNSFYGFVNHFSIKKEIGRHGYPYYFSKDYLKSHPELNVISVQRFDIDHDNRSNYACGGQNGTFVVTDNLGVSTTTAHEFGHGLGLPHVDGKACVGSRPSIMCMRGSTTEPEYQYNPKVKPGAGNGGTINPIYRVVRKSDVLSLRLNEIPKEPDGSQIIGPLTQSACLGSKL